MKPTRRERYATHRKTERESIKSRNERPLPPSIFLSLYDYKTGNLFTQDQLLTAWLHETRHAYQYRYDRKLYNSKDPEDPKRTGKTGAGGIMV